MSGGLARARAFDLRGHAVRETPPPQLSRRLLLAGVGGLAISGGSAAFLKGASARVYQTDIGEQMHVALDDGSQLFLDAQTRVSVAFSRRCGRWTMDYAASISASRRTPNGPSSSRRPSARSLPRIAISTCAARTARSRVVLIHGEADVKPASAGGRGERLTSGERLVASVDMEKRDRPDMVRQLAWQTGYESFDNQNLAAAADEMNRYSTARIEVDDSVANLKVSGIYRRRRQRRLCARAGQAAARPGAPKW